MTKSLKYIAASMLFACGCLFSMATNASVCFIPNNDCVQEQVPSGLVPPNVEETQCKNAGYTEESCKENEISYKCPYKSTWLKCCNKKFHYSVCVYPLENDGMCADYYACKCPGEYSITAEEAKNNNCNPGNYCTVNDGTQEITKYNGCTCDRAVYIDEDHGGKCGTGTASQNQTIAKSCTDSDGHKYHKCYCDRSAGKFPYASCEYGIKSGTQTCVDSSTQREYYHECATAEEACRRDGFEYTNCAARTCSKTVVNPETGRTETASAPCANGDKCPYPANPAMYKCVFNKATYCVGKGYSQTSEVSLADGSICTTPDGIEGNVQNCPANDGNPTFYYKCKVSCEKKLLSVAERQGFRYESQGLQGQGTFGRFGTASDGNANAYWVAINSPKNGFRKGNHLFLREDVRLPDNGLAYNNNTNGDFSVRTDGNGSLPIYQSINGISALYKFDPNLFSECEEDFNDTSKNPTITIPLNQKYDENTGVLSRDFHNINIKLTRYDDLNVHNNWGENIFRIYTQKDLGSSMGNGETRPTTTYIWENIGISVDDLPDTIHPENSDREDGVTGGMRYMRERAIIDLYNGTKIRLTGDIKFDTTRTSFRVGSDKSTIYNQEKGPKVQSIASSLAFRTQEYAIIEFKDARVASAPYSTFTEGGAIYEYGGGFPDFDSDCDSRGGDNRDGIMVIDNSTVYGNNHFGCLHLNMTNNSTYHLAHFFARATDENYYGGSSNYSLTKGSPYCVGAAIRNGSRLKINSSHGVTDIRKYLYIDGNSTVETNNPIRLMRSPKAVVCIGDSGSQLKVSVSGGQSTYGYGSHSFRASNASGYDTAARSSGVGYMQSLNTDKMYMYSNGNGACLPYQLNSDPSSTGTARDNANPWWELCTGNIGNNNADENNHMTDSVSTITPGQFDVQLRNTNYANSGTEYSTISGWYPKRTVDSITWRCDFDRKTVGGDSGSTSESANLKMCSTPSTVSGNFSAGNLEDEPEYTDGGFDTYYYYTKMSCRNRQFLCSGCWHCRNGIGYRDWSDSDGGL